MKDATSAARFALVGAATFLVLLVALHALKPELDPGWRFVSEYAIGPYGWVLQLGFLALAFSCLAAAKVARAHVTNRAGTVGVALLAVVGVALAAAAIFAMDPITARKDELTLHGSLHGVASTIGIPGFPIAALLITRSLRRNETWAFARRSLRWTAHSTWISLVFMFVVLGVLLPRNGGTFGPAVWIGWPNRLLVITYSAWLLVFARSGIVAAGRAAVRDRASAARVVGALVLVLLLGAAWRPAHAQTGAAADSTIGTVAPYLIGDRAAEIALARSAAPPAISDAATILVLTAHGYETAVSGTNGFVCLVDRKWQAPFVDPEFWNPRVRAPICLNPPAARSVLPVHLRRTQLALAGASKNGILTGIQQGFARGELRTPELGAMGYMMSRQQYLGDQDPSGQPHLMFYLPSSVRPVDWGADLPRSPIMAAPDRLPDGTQEPVNIFVVPLGHWSDGTAAK